VQEDTCPQFNYKWYNCLPENQPLSKMAPSSLFKIVKPGAEFIVKKLAGGVKPQAGAALFVAQPGITVHTKSTIVDDHWAIIGSNNVARRALYTDPEHAVAFVDEDDTAVKEYRKNLWCCHFRHNTPADFDDIQAGLHAWENAWGAAGAAPARPARTR